MPIEITMPRLSDTMEEGTLIKWRVKTGDKVKSGDILADVETDKATMELQCYDDGVVAQLAAGEGQTLPVGGLILVLAGEGENVASIAASPASATPIADAQPAASDVSATVTRPQTDAPDAEAQRQRVSPIARKIAEEKGIDLTHVQGTGPDGRIIKRDVEALLASAGTPKPPASSPRPQASAPSTSTTPAPKLESKTIALTSMRKTIAKRLVESKTTVPHFTVTVAADMDLLLGPRGAKKQLEAQGIKLSVNDFVVRAAALSLVKHPLINASWTGEAIAQHAAVNVGVAVALPPEKGGGLVVPVLRDVPSLGLRQINTQTRQLADKARTVGLTVEEMSHGTFTISNLGMFGVEHFEAIINPPQSAILAVGAALARPVVREGVVTVGQQMSLTLSADHRVIDGAMAADFLKTLREMLENPAILLV